MTETERAAEAEAEHERLARNVSELLQELRVAQGGVQILFGFLLSIAFTERYASVNDYVRGTHLVTVLFAAAAAALLTAPAAWHRLLFRQGRREQIVHLANRTTVAGLICLAVAMTGTVLLVSEIVVGGWPAVVVGVLVGLGFASLWFVLPMRRLHAVSGED
ncbi:DUF6328 family protein [Umezawaea beigongshangensis]|uniref:DUF6328 family protein n=1 Tax=Umezawaea beigongshangensis TaxID=2780383 RepID=UPI0018F14B1C|nr:DUF6328 family protein [Umezawaea beigongshangensis]